MRPIRVPIPGNDVTVPIPLDIYANHVSLALVNVNGIVDVDFEYTFDDVFDENFNPATANWFIMPDATGLTSASAHALAESQVAGNETGAPIKATAVRATNAAAGTGVFQVVQGGLQT